MSKADEMLKKVLPLCESALIKEQFVRNQIYFMEVIEETTNYLNRSEKLVVGSEWVCDVSCWISIGSKNQVMACKNDNVVKIIEITNEYFTGFQLNYAGMKTWAILPKDQFLACFSPKENI